MWTLFPSSFHFPSPFFVPSYRCVCCLLPPFFPSSGGSRILGLTGRKPLGGSNPPQSSTCFLSSAAVQLLPCSCTAALFPPWTVDVCGRGRLSLRSAAAVSCKRWLGEGGGGFNRAGTRAPTRRVDGPSTRARLHPDGDSTSFFSPCESRHYLSHSCVSGRQAQDVWAGVY